ncbi:uncharacterized protein LOC131658157 [Vicia villosa]|uniref:uncharacterized protein LOC131658155 n=1 Tax=Vicia villosa TaxID=3911 RepID=UPI00273C6AC0|nr:uncharacterized protein LOC131658155 [Vicia villosa]XP_058783468.1 uncharacterized protein LOC131658156 [Vicia villosa]XP_058783469.1 uncharacterized protein LOC131658157 [Vicia villosa]
MFHFGTNSTNLSEQGTKQTKDTTSFDKWRKNDTLNFIKDQGNGNCCYAFAVCDVIEALYFINNGEPIFLSVQDIYNHLIKNETDDIEGRTIRDALKFISENGCILAHTCPYEQRFKPTGYPREVFLRIETYDAIDLQRVVLPKKKSIALEKLEKNVEEEIRTAPVAAQLIWIEGDLKDFKGSDIYSGPRNADAFLDAGKHGVVIVGYGEEKVKKKLKKYWIVKNSHGKDWGDLGYIKIDRAPCYGQLLIEAVFLVRGVAKEKAKDGEA